MRLNSAPAPWTASTALCDHHPMDTTPDHKARTPGPGRPLPQEDGSEPGGSHQAVRGPVIGLTSPRLVGQMRRARPVAPFHTTALEFSDPPAARSHRFLTVTTRPARRGPGSRSSRLETALWLARERLTAPADTTAGDQPAPVLSAVEHASVQVEGRPVACVLRRLGDLWAAEVHLSAEVLLPWPGAAGTTVTVVARGITVDEVRLDPVEDLEPFHAAAKERQGIRLSQQRRSSIPPEPVSFSSIQSLILAGLEDAPNPGRYAEVRNWMLDLHELWTAAHRAQMRFAGLEPAPAAQALDALMNHMRTLANAVPWWQEAGAEAVSESVRCGVFGSEVPSRPAQDQWARGITDAAAAKHWLQSWQQWYDRRPHL